MGKVSDSIRKKVSLAPVWCYNFQDFSTHLQVLLRTPSICVNTLLTQIEGSLCCGGGPTMFWLMSVAILSQVAPLANCSFRSWHPRWMSPCWRTLEIFRACVASAQDAPRSWSSSVWCRAFQHHRAAEHPSIRGRHAKLINMSQRPTALTTQKSRIRFRPSKDRNQKYS